MHFLSNAIYALPLGELSKGLIIYLRQGRTIRRSRLGGVDRRGQMPERVSSHLRLLKIEDRMMPRHWEGDLIKGNASAVGARVARVSAWPVFRFWMVQ